MLEYINKIREIAERALREKKVDMVIGFRKGTMPMMNEPCFIKNPDQVESLVWDSNCGINLANYLTDRTEKIAVIAKGCDSRSIVTHITENKIKRDQLFIIGVPCKGMIDKRKVASETALRNKGEIDKVTEVSGKVIVNVDETETSFDRTDVLQQNCALCIHRNPVIYDELAGDLVEEQKVADRYEDVRKIESMSLDEKQNYFKELLSSCIRCYACKNACPLCYCPTCFVDEAKPQWLGKGQEPVDIQTFHFLRAYHCAGRCTDCGACERACPVGINMRILTRKLEKDSLEQFGWESGLSLEKRPPLDTWNSEDPDDFIK
jgi:coenzyme F420-reducing hydrogenase beta subunit